MPTVGSGADTARMLAANREEDLAVVGRGVDTRLLCEAAAVEPQQVRAELERASRPAAGPVRRSWCASNPW